MQCIERNEPYNILLLYIHSCMITIEKDMNTPYHKQHKKVIFKEITFLWKSNYSGNKIDDLQSF